MRIFISLFLKTVLVAIFFFQFSEDVDGLNVCLRDPRRPFYYLPSSRNGRIWLWFLVDFLLNHNFVMIFYWFYRNGDQVIQERLINIPFFSLSPIITVLERFYPQGPTMSIWTKKLQRLFLNGKFFLMKY